MSRAEFTLSAKAIRKVSFRTRLTSLLSQYDVFLLVKADNVGSKQLQDIRKSLRGKAEILFGKNTMILSVLRECVDRYPGLENIMPYIKGKTGLVFTNDDIRDIRSMLVAKKVQRAAKAGAVAPVKVVIPAGNTNLEPTKTSFFQALSIPSKINKGSISLDNSVNLISAGEKVTHSQAALLQMLNIKPFQFGLSVGMVYDHGSVWSMAHDSCADGDNFTDLIKRGIFNVAALATAASQEDLFLSLQARFPAVFGAGIAVSGHGDPAPDAPTTGAGDSGDGDDVSFFPLFGDDDDDANAGDSDVLMSGGLFGDDEDEAEAKAKPDTDEDEPALSDIFFGNGEEDY